MAATVLTRDDFRGYPPEARALVDRNLALLGQLPRAFLPLLLREVIVYDWKFPAERDEIDRQLRYLGGLSTEQLASAMSGFAALRLPAELEQSEWIANPGRFSERLSASLWATRQIDDFGKAAESYLAAFNAAVPEPPAPAPRLAMVVLAREMSAAGYPLFRKLRASGTYFTNVNPGGGYELLAQTLADRARRFPMSYAHWCIDGAASPSVLSGPQVASVAYNSLSAVRDDLIRKMRDSSVSGAGPEAIKTRLAETDPAAVGFNGRDADPVLSRFSLSVLSEGSGTQIYSTTFVQWTAREALRRARPLTLLAKFAPRQTEESADEALQGTQKQATLDLAGSLIDADMGAFYTWINLQRLSGAENSGFLAWFEGHGEALAISPGIAVGKVRADRVELAEVLRLTQTV